MGCGSSAGWGSPGAVTVSDSRRGCQPGSCGGAHQRCGVRQAPWLGWLTRRLLTVFMRWGSSGVEVVRAPPRGAGQDGDAQLAAARRQDARGSSRSAWPSKRCSGRGEQVASWQRWLLARHRARSVDDQRVQPRHRVVRPADVSHRDCAAPSAICRRAQPRRPARVRPPPAGQRAGLSVTTAVHQSYLELTPTSGSAMPRQSAPPAQEGPQPHSHAARTLTTCNR